MGFCFLPSHAQRQCNGISVLFHNALNVSFLQLQKLERKDTHCSCCYFGGFKSVKTLIKSVSVDLTSNTATRTFDKNGQ